jgi:drug/metabolite transporter (DMT)-like permease
MVADKYIGLALAISSSFAIGTSFIITKKGLKDASKQGFDGDGHEYLKNPIWWAGMLTMAVGEIANFAAYTFAPAILVTPLGALSVIIGAVLAAMFLREELGTLGKMGCAICLLGSVIIVLHAPSDKDIETVDEILQYALTPFFMAYVLIVTVFALVMIYRIAPIYGTKNPIYYISICSSVGSISIVSIKAFGIALKLTLSGNNQFTHFSTYLFITVVVVCIMTQMNYFNKALDQFDTSIVNPLYYVTFTTATLAANFILFRNYNDAGPKDSISLICGFLIIFSGVYLLNISRKKNETHRELFSQQEDLSDIPLEGGVGAFQTRRSINLQRARSLSHTDEEAVGLRRFESFSIHEEEEDRFRV